MDRIFESPADLVYTRPNLSSMASFSSCVPRRKNRTCFVICAMVIQFVVPLTATRARCDFSSAGVSYHGSPTFVTVNASSAAGCCGTCGITARCNSWTLQPDGRCHLKEDRDPRPVASRGCQSGTIVIPGGDGSCPAFNDTRCTSDADCDQVRLAFSLCACSPARLQFLTSPSAELAPSAASRYRS